MGSVMTLVLVLTMYVELGRPSPGKMPSCVICPSNVWFILYNPSEGISVGLSIRNLDDSCLILVIDYLYLT